MSPLPPLLLPSPFPHVRQRDGIESWPQDRTLETKRLGEGEASLTSLPLLEGEYDWRGCVSSRWVAPPTQDTVILPPTFKWVPDNQTLTCLLMISISSSLRPISASVFNSRLMGDETQSQSLWWSQESHKGRWVRLWTPLDHESVRLELSPSLVTGPEA